MRKSLALAVVSTALVYSLLPTARAASTDSPKPIVTWGCTLTRQIDHQGMYLFFHPQAKVKWQGKKITYKFYNTTDKTMSLADDLIGQGTVSATGKGLNAASLYLSRKFRKFEDAKYLNLRVVVTDLEKQTGVAQCVWNGRSAAGL